MTVVKKIKLHVAMRKLIVKGGCLDTINYFPRASGSLVFSRALKGQYFPISDNRLLSKFKILSFRQTRLHFSRLDHKTLTEYYVCIIML